MENQNIIRRLPAPIAVSEQEWPESTTPVVSVCCMTYNHENFIRKCLDGVLNQETLFPIEILVHDDASTDQTASIIQKYEKRYPNSIKAIYQEENQWSKGVRPNPAFNFPRAQGKYIAFCEGDDYWSDKGKLQQQFDIIEKYPDVKLCFHKVLVVHDGDHARLGTPTPILTKTFYSCRELVSTNIIPTCSVLAIREAVIETPDWYYKLPMNDWPRWISACKDGYAYGINKVMGVYRIHSGGIWSAQNVGVKVISDYDFYCEIEKNGPICSRALAADARRALVRKLINQEEERLFRIRNHVIFGPLLKLWEKFINKNIFS
ncbi:glycosyltransferase [uncultured Desulfosarcina sp.]|uniref:glycosyltransferase n=1 Tax=uncultured Desulfosarcina sp. TaxID=218289 RepID=UPI0029C724D7|nr:glycosyltransferase [uncultured Desulfosarcina sp.]